MRWDVFGRGDATLDAALLFHPFSRGWHCEALPWEYAVVKF